MQAALPTWDTLAKLLLISRFNTACLTHKGVASYFPEAVHPPLAANTLVVASSMWTAVFATAQSDGSSSLFRHRNAVDSLAGAPDRAVSTGLTPLPLQYPKADSAAPNGDIEPSDAFTSGID